MSPVEHSDESGRQWPERRWSALAVLLVAAFMDLLDTTIVNVAIPSIRDDLDTSYAVVQWIVAGYLLAFAVGLITGGRLGDIFGRRRVFLYGVVAFGLTSLASGLAPSGGALVAARILQGLSAAVMIPQLLSIVQVSFPRDEQRKALAIYSSIAGVAVMSGPLMAGVLIDLLDLSWRSIFLINVPVSVAVLFAGAALIPESRAADARVDVRGMLIVTAALFALVFGVIQGRELDWPTWVFGLMALSIPLFALFAVYERRFERRGGSPLVSLSLFGARAFSGGLLVVLVLFSGIVGFFLAFTVFLQLGLGYSPLESALTTFPSSIGVVVASQVSAKLVPRFGRRVLQAGTVLMAVAMAGLVLVVGDNGGALAPWDVRPVIFVFGFGMGLILPSLADAIIAGVEERNAGAASGVVNTGMQVGNAVGVAIIGAILFSSLASHAPESAARAERDLAREVAAAGLPAGAQREILASFRACFVERSRQTDPAEVPSSCHSDALAAAGPGARDRSTAAVDAASERAREDNFVVSIQRALAYAIAVFAVTFGLLFLLPAGGRRAGKREPEAVPAPVPEGGAA